MGLGENEVRIRLVTDFKELDQIADQWNAIVEKSSNNPFLLFDFNKQTLNYVPQDWTPFMLIISKGKIIVGIAPLRIRVNLVEHRVEFLQAKWHSDFIFSDKYREVCIKRTCEFLFTNLKCNHANFVFPHDSPNVSLLERYCRLYKIHLETYSEMGRRVILKCSSWREFILSRTSKFEKKLKRMKQNLKKSGSWSVVCIEGNKQTEITKRIFEVEKKSWKENWRLQKGEKDDWGLKIILKAAPNLFSTVPNFGLQTWFLELNGKTIAYVMMITYKETAIMVKTSYVNHFRKLSPGKFTLIHAIRQLFNENQIKYIDLLTDMNYMHFWTNNCFLRVGVVLTKGIMPTILLIIKQKLLYTLRSSSFFMKIVEGPLSQGSFAGIFDVFLDRFI